MAALLLPSPARSQAIMSAPAPAVSAPALSWTDLADLALASPVVLVADVAKVDRLGKRDAPDVPPGQVRALVEGRLRAALKAPAVLPAGAAWLWQGPATAKGRVPFGKAAPLILFASLLSGGSKADVQPLRLSSAHGQQPWDAATEAVVRSILVEAVRPANAGLMVTGISDGFRSTGDVPGQSESQYFLRTEGGRPLTLVVRRAADAEPSVTVATGELVDRARPVAPRTLLWRGLACGLPEALPEALAADAGLVEDYALARASIGACGRTVLPPR